MGSKPSGERRDRPKRDASETQNPLGAGSDPSGLPLSDTEDTDTFLDEVRPFRSGSLASSTIGDLFDTKNTLDSTKTDTLRLTRKGTLANHNASPSPDSALLMRRESTAQYPGSPTVVAGKRNSGVRRDRSHSGDGQFGHHRVSATSLISGALPSLGSFGFHQRGSDAVATHFRKPQGGPSPAIGTSFTIGRKAKQGRVRIGTPDAQLVSRLGRVSPTLSVCSRASSVTSFALRTVIPFDFLSSNVLRRDQLSEVTQHHPELLPSLLLTDEDVAKSKELSGDLCGPTLVIGDCGEDIVAVIMVLSMMETYCVKEYGRMMCTLFSYVIACGSGGYIALSMSQGETLQSLLEMLLQHDQTFLKKRENGEYSTDGTRLTDTIIQFRFAEDKIEDSLSMSGGRAQRRMNQRYRRGDYFVARPCIITAERNGNYLRLVDWKSRALVHRMYAVAANCVTDIDGSSYDDDSPQHVTAGIDEIPDPVMFALKINPRPSVVCRVAVGPLSAQAEAHGDAMAEEMGTDFIDIILPQFTDVADEEPGRSQSLERSGGEKFAMRSSIQEGWMSATSYGLDNTVSGLSPMQDLLQQWNLDGKDKQHRVGVMSQTEQFIQENEDSLQRVIDYIIVKAAKPQAMTPPEVALY